jgi:hypothetical protein
MRWTFRFALLGIPIACLASVACGGEEAVGSDEPARNTEHRASPPVATFPSTFARQWMTNFANSVKGDTLNPALAARTYAYAGVALYESVVHGMPGHQSLAGQLNGLGSLPEPDPSLDYDWPTVLAQTMSRVGAEIYVHPFPLFYEFTTPTQAALQALGPQQIGYRRVAGVPEATIQNSIDFANRLADVYVAWANADGYHALRFKPWPLPTGPDKWVPTGFSDSDKVANPVEPWFGDVRPMVLTSNRECWPGDPPPYSTAPGSPFFEQANAVYQAETALTDQQREIADFWADGPGATPTPSGHWIAILTQRARTQSLDVAVREYALISAAAFDAFITVWETKFEYNVLRPETYIRRHIDPSWKPYLPTPQFPEYISGHSGQSGAVATVLDRLLGGVPFVDSTKLRRGFGTHAFANYMQAAQEAADSRLYGGIHYPISNQRGLALGVCVGNAVVDRLRPVP